MKHRVTLLQYLEIKNGGIVSELKTNCSTSMTRRTSKLAQIINIMVFTEMILEMR